MAPALGFRFIMIYIFFFALILPVWVSQNNDFCSSAKSSVCYTNEGISVGV